MKKTRLTRLVAAAVGATLAVSAASLVAATTNAFAAGPAVTVTNGTGVVTDSAGNPQGTPPYNITLNLTGFGASSGITVALCTGHNGSSTFPYPSDASGCTSFHSSATGNTNSSGAATIPFTVYSATATQTGAGFQCDFTDPCTLYVGQQLSDFSQPHVFQDVDYNPPPPTAAYPGPGGTTAPSPQLATAQQGGNVTVTVNYGVGHDSNGIAETADPSSSAVTTAPTNGHVTPVSGQPGKFQYVNDINPSATSDTFTVSGATFSCPAPPPSSNDGPCSGPATATGTPVQVNITLSAAPAHSQLCDASTGSGTITPVTPPSGYTMGCNIDQVLTVPVSGADLTIIEPTSPLTATGNPAGAGGLVTLLNKTLVSSACTGPAITLNGQPQNACGALAPVTVVNARGTDNNWQVTGQVTDFLDPNHYSTTPAAGICDSPATYNNHCIPGGNLSWGPVAAVGHDIVPGDTAQVAAGPVVAAPPVQAALLNNPADNSALTGTKNQTEGTGNLVTEPGTSGGLLNAAQTLCITAAGQSGGTFNCGANLVVAVPASAAASTAPGYQAILTLTLLG